jgi:hypothetical protein
MEGTTGDDSTIKVLVVDTPDSNGEKEKKLETVSKDDEGVEGVPRAHAKQAQMKETPIKMAPRLVVRGSRPTEGNAKTVKPISSGTSIMDDRLTAALEEGDRFRGEDESLLSFIRKVGEVD